MTNKMTIIYWKSNKFWLGKLVEHPEIMTQGETLEKFKEKIKDAYYTVQVYCKDKPIAEIVPFPKQMPSWKREIPRLTLKGLILSQEIQKDRRKARESYVGCVPRTINGGT
jgi:predicted RNase H-like HicB family nuclease